MAKRLWDKGYGVNQRVHHFTVGNDPLIDVHIFPWDVLASAAHARVLLDAKILTRDELSKVLVELKKIYKQVQTTPVVIPPELEDAHTTLEMMLTERLGDLGKKIHTGRSRNDQVLVAMRLLLKSEVIATLRTLATLAESLFSRAEKAQDIPMPGYTHFQPAMPSSVAMWLQAFAEHALDHLEEGFRLLERIDTNPLGVASGFYVPLALKRDISTKALTFRTTQRNPIHVQNLRGREELAVVRWWSDIATSIEKMAFDFILFSSYEYRFFSLPLSFTTGSSIMPQKRNPDVLELLRASASKIRASAFELDGLTSKLPSSYHRDFQFTKEPLIRSAQIISDLVPICTEVVNEFTINTERLKDVMYPDLYATYQVYRLVRDGRTFREAYQEVGSTAVNNEQITDLHKDYQIIAEQLAAELAQGRHQLATLLGRVGSVEKSFAEVENVLDE